MKRFLACLLALALTVCSAPAAYAAVEEDSPAAETRLYSYSTAARGVFNFAHFYLSGDDLLIRRRAYHASGFPDTLTIRAGNSPVLKLSLDWDEGYVEGFYSGYDFDLALDTLSDGRYALSLESAESTAAGEAALYLSRYQLATVYFVKEEGEIYFPEHHALSNRNNLSLLQQLQEGDAPDDFTALLTEYGQEEEQAEVLQAIEDTVRDITAGSYTDLDKCLAIHQWVVQNIAYDFDFPRDDAERWVESHPGDAPRVEDPLYAYEQGYAMCYGYTRLTTLMLGYAGVESVYVKGRYGADVGNQTFTSEELEEYNHAWNAVKISGTWYYLDTCIDALYSYYRTDPDNPCSGYTINKRGPSFVYVFPSPDQISNTHIALRYGVEKYGKKVDASL